MKIVVTGKNGLLSKELQSLDNTIIGLPSIEYDITDPNIIPQLTKLNPDIIIHAAAFTNSTLIHQSIQTVLDVNIIGTAYIAKYCSKHNKRLIFISTDYIYPGVTGDYKETDPIHPVNEYAWTKLGGECSVKLVLNHLIIRTSFGSSKFPYKEAWTNQIVSKDYVDIIAPMILKVSKSDTVGIINIGTSPKSLYEYSLTRNDNISPIKNKVSKNFSLNINKYEQLFSN